MTNLRPVKVINLCSIMVANSVMLTSAKAPRGTDVTEKPKLTDLRPVEVRHLQQWLVPRLVVVEDPAGHR